MRGKWFLKAAVGAMLTAACLASPAMAQSSDEAPGDTSSRVRLSGAADGVLTPAGDQDWYRLSVRTGRSYHITLNGAGEGEAALGDPLLQVLDAEGNELTSNDDSDGLNSALDYMPAANGDVFVVARGFAEDAVGAYHLAVTDAVLPPDDFSADTRTRGRIAVGGSADGSVQYGGDKDWFRIRLEAGQSYRFNLVAKGEGDGALGDPMLHLLSPSGEELASDDDGGGGLNSYIEFTASEAGNYYLAAGGFSEGATGAYTLRAAAGDIPAATDTDAELSADGDYREGRLSPAGDSDWYKFALSEGQTVRIALDSNDAESGFDPLLKVHGPDGAELATDDDGGDGLNSFLEFTAPSAGNYFVEARGFLDEAEGGYSLNIIPGEIPNIADGAESLVVNGEGRTSVLGVAGDADWFVLETIEGRPYRFNLEGYGEGALADPVLTLFNGEGQQIAADDDGGAGTNSYLTYTSVDGAPIYAAVSSFGDAGTGAYSLRVVDTDVPGHNGTDEYLDLTEGSDERVSNIDMPGDLDLFSVQLEAGVRYTITVAGQGDHPLTDPFLTLLNAETGETITTDDDSGPGLDSRLVYTPTVAGSFYVQASGLGGSVGGYLVSVTRE